MTVVTKANILKKTDGKFTAICHEVAADYPEISVDDYYIDIMAANLVNERVRGQFQVLLLPNLYGDIITDEAAEIQGGVGTAGSANIGSVPCALPVLWRRYAAPLQPSAHKYSDNSEAIAELPLWKPLACVPQTLSLSQILFLV